MNITGAIVIKGFGPDKVTIHTDLPCATYPFEGFQTLSFDVAKDKGADYIKEYFGIMPEIIQRIKLTPRFKS